MQGHMKFNKKMRRLGQDKGRGQNVSLLLQLVLRRRTLNEKKSAHLSPVAQFSNRDIVIFLHYLPSLHTRNYEPVKSTLY
jgi:hypothetical protein